MTTRALPAALAARPLAVVGDYVRLTKPRIISLLLVTTAGAMFVAAAGVPDGWLLFWTMVGGYLAARRPQEQGHRGDREDRREHERERAEGHRAAAPTAGEHSPGHGPSADDGRTRGRLTQGMEASEPGTDGTP